MGSTNAPATQSTQTLMLTYWRSSLFGILSHGYRGQLVREPEYFWILLKYKENFEGGGDSISGSLSCEEQEVRLFTIISNTSGQQLTECESYHVPCNSLHFRLLLPAATFCQEPQLHSPQTVTSHEQKSALILQQHSSPKLSAFWIYRKDYSLFLTEYALCQPCEFYSSTEISTW